MADPSETTDEAAPQKPLLERCLFCGKRKTPLWLPENFRRKQRQRDKEKKKKKKKKAAE